MANQEDELRVWQVIAEGYREELEALREFYLAYRTYADDEDFCGPVEQAARVQRAIAAVEAIREKPTLFEGLKEGLEGALEIIKAKQP